MILNLFMEDKPFKTGEKKLICSFEQEWFRLAHIFGCLVTREWFYLGSLAWLENVYHWWGTLGFQGPKADPMALSFPVP